MLVERYLSLTTRRESTWRRITTTSKTAIESWTTHATWLVHGCASAHRAVHFEYWVRCHLCTRLLRHWRSRIGCLVGVHAALPARTVTTRCIRLHLILLHACAAFLAGSSLLIVLVLHESLFGGVHGLLAWLHVLLPGRLGLILSGTLGRRSSTASSYHLSVQVWHSRIKAIWLTFLG